jgi:hypothetical protein
MRKNSLFLRGNSDLERNIIMPSIRAIIAKGMYE